MSRAPVPIPIQSSWRMKMAQGDPYRPREITGDADPTMISPKAHRTATRTAIAGAVPSLEAQPGTLEGRVLPEGRPERRLEGRPERRPDDRSIPSPELEG